MKKISVSHRGQDPVLTVDWRSSSSPVRVVSSNIDSPSDRECCAGLWKMFSGKRGSDAIGKGRILTVFVQPKGKRRRAVVMCCAHVRDSGQLEAEIAVDEDLQANVIVAALGLLVRAGRELQADLMDGVEAFRLKLSNHLARDWGPALGGMGLKAVEERRLPFASRILEYRPGQRAELVAPRARR